MRTTYERIKIISNVEHLADIRLHMETWVHTEMIHNYVRGKDSLCVHRYMYICKSKDRVQRIYFTCTYIYVQYVRLITLTCICTFVRMYTHIHIKIHLLYILYIYALFYIYTFTRGTSKKMPLYVCMFYCPYQFYLRLFSISLCCCAFSLCFKSLFVCMCEYVYTCDNANLFDNA